MIEGEMLYFVLILCGMNGDIAYLFSVETFYLNLERVMEKCLGKINKEEQCDGSYRFSSDNGHVSIRFVTGKVIEVENFMNGYETPSYLRESSSFISSKSESFNPISVVNYDYYTLKYKKTQVDINKENSNISVSYNGYNVLSDILGTKDTVIPHSQFRLIGTKDYTKGRFTFPLDKGDNFYGLGDKGGKLNRKDGRYRMYNRDSLGYDASFSDPLYKSIPFFIKENAGNITGFFFPETSLDAFDFGKESPYYFSLDIIGGPFKYYVILGDDYKDILSSYCFLSGYPTLPPLFSFGYLGSSMNYVESYDAEKRIYKFFNDTEKYGLPCEGMYVSSGYLKADDGSRFAFIWNKRKFPNPGDFIGALEKKGYHLLFNIKPGILLSHPWYKEMEEKGYFVKDANGKPIVEFFWGGDASFVDFSNNDAKEFWKKKLKENYLDYGVEGIWNDNNEAESEDYENEAYHTRAIYPVKMAEASFEALMEVNPTLRPWVYSRSGWSGMQRYSRTWTGDNTSTFKTLKFNQYQAISLGLSGVPFVGHDLGGFFGPEPTSELLVRSAQSAIFQTRFVIHSWREDDEPTEPWKDKDAFPLIKEALFDHYRHMPYIYNTAYNASVTGIPMERALCLEYPEDKNISSEIEEFMFGDSVLKAPVLNEEQRDKDIYFPMGDNWYSPSEGILYKGGERHIFSCPLDKTWYFYKTGSVIPLSNKVESLRTSFFPHLAFFILPKNGEFSFRYFEDDGRTRVEEGKYNIWKLTVTYDAIKKEGKVTIESEYIGNSTSFKDRNVKFSFPEGFVGEKVLSFDDLSTNEVIFKGQYLKKEMKK